MSGVHVDDDAQNAGLSSLNPSALQNYGTSLRYLLRAINYQVIESAYAVQPGRPDLGLGCPEGTAGTGTGVRMAWVSVSR